MGKYFDGELLSGYEESSKDWQLLDKDKTIADLEAKLAEIDKEAQEIYEMYNQERKKNWLYNRKNQDKISFAVERLEKVRSNILCNERFYFENLNKYIDETIDNQIKQIKEMN